MLRLRLLPVLVRTCCFFFETTESNIFQGIAEIDKYDEYMYIYCFLNAYDNCSLNNRDTVLTSVYSIIQFLNFERQCCCGADERDIFYIWFNRAIEGQSTTLQPKIKNRQIDCTNDYEKEWEYICKLARFSIHKLEAIHAGLSLSLYEPRRC